MVVMGGGTPGVVGFGSSEKVVNNLVIKGKGITALPKVAQGLIKVTASGTETAGISGMNTAYLGGSTKDIINSLKNGFLVGAGTRGIGIGLKSTIPQISKIRKTAINDAFKRKAETIKVAEKPIQTAKSVKSAIPKAANKAHVEGIAKTKVERVQTQVEDKVVGLDRVTKIRKAPKVEEVKEAKVITKKVIKPEIKRIDYLREKYGKLSPAELNEKINVRGINAEAIKAGSKNTWGGFLSDHMGKGKTVEQIKDSYTELIKKQSAWPEGYDSSKNIITLKEGDTFDMVLDKDQRITKPGGFGILNNVPSRDFARNNMAIKLGWKNNCGKTITYIIKKGMQLDCPSGPVGPQIDLLAD